MWLAPLSWYLIVSILGLVSFPLLYSWFPGLEDRGYTISRAFGLLVWGYLFWLFSSMGVLVNSAGGYLIVFVALLAAGWLAWKRVGLQAFKDWFSDHRKMIFTAELVFALGFVFLLLLRAMDPAIFGTEKPMEFAFINAFLRSDTMPPLDPWLADYAISYYYFGYVMVGMLIKFSGVSSGVGFNLGLSMVFALAAIGAYGIVYNLLAALRPQSRHSLAGLPILGPLFVLVLSNVEGFLEFIHGRGAFWQQVNGQWTSAFWQWVNLDNLRLPPPGNTAPGELRHWWWWRASRVVADFNFFGNFQEVIDEFPFFSFFLGDLHPHVLALPFVFVALALSLNMFLDRNDEERRLRIFNLEYHFSARVFLLGVLVFGGLGFLNIWDFPWYVVIFAGVHLLKKVAEAGWSRHRIYEFVILVIAFGVGGVLAYLPFYISFSSQAGGILPNVINPTRGIHLWIMFGTLFTLLLVFMVFLLLKRRALNAMWKGLGLALAAVVGLLVFSILLTFLLGGGIPLGSANQIPNLFLGMYGVDDLGPLLQEGLARRASSIFSVVTLVLLLGLALGVLWPARQKEEQPSTETDLLPKSHLFAAALVVVGAALVLIPEFVYLRDLFGNRMNTIFKFYYQAWILWSLAAAYGSGVILSEPKTKRSLAIGYTVVLVVVMFVGLTYPLMTLQTRLSSFQAQSDTKLVLDGAANNIYLNPDEHAAVDWLKQAPLRNLVEAVHPAGGSYTQYARISMNSGQPALLGWTGHEGQWRGGGEEMGTRKDDIARLYQSRNWQEAAQIIEQYQIVYIVVGNLERTTYDVYEEKFIRNLTPAFQQGSVTIYQVQSLVN